MKLIEKKEDNFHDREQKEKERDEKEEEKQ